MMMNNTTRIAGGISVLIVIAVVSLWMWRIFNPNGPEVTPSPRPGNPDIVCTQEYNPVCGVDGKTYPNACVATEQNGVAIATQGECPPQSSMSADQRKYLLWLLVERKEQQLAEVVIRHERTIAADDGARVSYYYAWNDPTIIARVIVENGSIVSALDSTGYNYLTQKIEVPVDFPELMDQSS